MSHREKIATLPPGEFEPGLYWNWDSVELKYDGQWGELVFEDGIWQMWSRHGKVKAAGVFGCGNRTVLLGEFLFGTQWAKDRPDYRDFVAFDIAELDGENVLKMWRLRERREFLKTAMKANAFPDFVTQAEYWPMRDAERLWKERVETGEYEGLMFKHGSAMGAEGWGRMKRPFTMDYVCIDVTLSDSDTYAGWGAKALVGGLYVDGTLKKVVRVSGMTDEERADHWTNRDEYIGRVFEAKGRGLFKSGALRHPSFVGWRDDKRAEECTWPE